MRITIREKLGLSKPWNSGFDRGGDFSVHCTREFVVDGCRDGKGGYSAAESPLSEVKREASSWMRGVAGLSVGWWLGLSARMLLKA